MIQYLGGEASASPFAVAPWSNWQLTSLISWSFGFKSRRRYLAPLLPVAPVLCRRPLRLGAGAILCLDIRSTEV